MLVLACWQVSANSPADCIAKHMCSLEAKMSLSIGCLLRNALCCMHYSLALFSVEVSLSDVNNGAHLDTAVVCQMDSLTSQAPLET